MLFVGISGFHDRRYKRHGRIRCGWYTSCRQRRCSFWASKRRKTKMYSTVQDLIAKARASTELANEADDIETFLSYYHSMLSETHELIAFEDRVPFTLKPSIQYDIFVNNKQWHTRDAIERHYNSVKKAAKTTYRNSRSHVESLCRIFADEIEKHKNEFMMRPWNLRLNYATSYLRNAVL